MLKKKWIVPALLCLSMSQLCFASKKSATLAQTLLSNTSSKNIANMNANHFSITASSLGLGYSSAAGFLFAISPKVEYFVLDRVSVGGRVGVSTASGGYFGASAFEIGPSATYYFWENNRFAAYGTGAFLFQSVPAVSGMNSLANYKLEVAGGVNYSFFSWFAAGPSLRISTDFRGINFDIALVNLSFFI